MEQLSGILPLILIFVVFYFLLIRPQQKKLKSHKEMITNLKKGDKVALIGFGTFSISARAARTGRNPQTGATIQIKAKKVAKFKAGSALSDSVN